ncbi:glycosyltransferase family 4 protein [Candidatus Woesebacteria bacterium]|nr:glycosyltransferase family 4 protein [Candidatus Woesebacteria bacterium]
MTIGIDGNEANVAAQVGVSVYTHQLLHHFARLATEREQFLVYLRRAPLDSMPPENDFFKYRIVKGRFLWSQIFLPFELYMHKDIDIFFAPAHYAPRYCPVPIVVTIHDLSFFYFPNEFLQKDLYQLKNWTAYSIKKAKRIIAVSKTTKKDILKLYGVPDTQIDMVYNGFEKKIDKDEPITVLDKYNLHTGKYILYVGTIQPRKNLKTLIQAYDIFLKNNPGYKLVLTGKKGWMFEETLEAAQEHLKTKEILITGYETDENVIELYKNAFCYCLPSLYEGFGIPILEAMSNNCPVITSHTSSLPEIGGDACLYFDPRDPQELAAKLSQLHDNENLKQELIKKGKERVTQFSWKKSAIETLDVIRYCL